MADEHADIVVVGAGAAGLMAAISAARRAPGRRVVALDGAKTIGAKILVAGGGRCNVTHHAVTERDYAGGNARIIKHVLAAFGVRDTVRFFEDLGVTLKHEETGKLFPTTDRARTVLDALLTALRESGAELRFPARVRAVERAASNASGAHFRVVTDESTISAERVILATGGKALPKSGSDGAGYAIATALGHTLTDPIIPSLVPLVVNEPEWLRQLSGVAVTGTLHLVSSTGKRLRSITHDILCTHFGLSGPGPMDMSRHWAMVRLTDPQAHLIINWLSDASATTESVDAALQSSTVSALAWLRTRLPERLARALLDAAHIDPAASLRQLTRDSRRSLAALIAECPVRPTETRGFTYAEATAGGVPLEEIHAATLASRVCDGLFLSGEILDVDGRIGGFNFQWAWATGHLAGKAAAASLPPR